VNTGRGIGVIDTLHLVEVAQAVLVLEQSGMQHPAIAPIKKWFEDYLIWLTTSKNGTDERDEANNHGSCWVLQAAAFARLTGNNAVIEFCRKRFKQRLIPVQIAPDGRQPLELARTKPFGYCLFNLEALGAAAHILSRQRENLWSYQTSDGRSLAKAAAFMFPYIQDKSSWPFAKDVEYFDQWPVRQSSLLFGGLALKRRQYLAQWKLLDPDPAVPEVIRNFPIRQPRLWIKNLPAAQTKMLKQYS
jgi:hypothetical protein